MSYRPHTPARRTQAQRSEAMRKRLLQATISCLQTNGYSGTTMSQIIAIAGVSRGAPLHHFSSKAALIAAAAQEMIARLNNRLGNALAGLGKSDDPLRKLVYSIWNEVFNSPDHLVLLELLTASRHDPEITYILRRIWKSSRKTVIQAADYYLASTLHESDVAEMMIMTQWFLRGMAEDNRLMDNDAIVNRHLDLWCEMLSQRLRVKT